MGSAERTRERIGLTLLDELTVVLATLVDREWLIRDKTKEELIWRLSSAIAAYGRRNPESGIFKGAAPDDRHEGRHAWYSALYAQLGNLDTLGILTAHYPNKRIEVYPKKLHEYADRTRSSATPAELEELEAFSTFFLAEFADYAPPEDVQYYPS